MLGIRSRRSLVHAAGRVLGALLAGAHAAGGPSQRAHAAEGTVTLEWLGHEFYRLTSPGAWWS